MLGVAIGGEARAYPIAILNWHEVVNDSIGRQSFVVSYCPLCGSGVVFASNGTMLPATTAYWFAWYAFHPDTQLFQAGD